MPTVTRSDRARGGLLGLAVADALGAPLEFAAAAQAAAAVEAGLEMTGGGTFGWLPGEWTDDTTMALCLAESIGAHGLVELDDVTRRYADWARTGPKDIGNATSAALRGASSAAEARKQAQLHLARTGSGAGNGTIMRAAPIGLAARSLAEAVDAARADAALTHGDARAGHASAALCAALLSFDDPVSAARAECGSEPKLLEALDARADELASTCRGRGRRLLDGARRRAPRVDRDRRLRARRPLGNLARRRHGHERRCRGRAARREARRRGDPGPLARRLARA